MECRCDHAGRILPIHPLSDQPLDFQCRGESRKGIRQLAALLQDDKALDVGQSISSSSSLSRQSGAPVRQAECETSRIL